MADHLPDVGPIGGARRELATSRLVPQHRLDRQGYESGDFWLGKTFNGKPFGWREDLNLLTCAGPRAGKGVGVIVPNLLLFPGSAVVIDPKGELATLTARHRAEKLGQQVVVLDPCGVAEVPDKLRGTFNPLAQLDARNPGVVSAAQTLASAIVVPNPEAKEPFWDQTASSFIQAVILYMVLFFDSKDRTLMKLRQTASIGDWDLLQQSVNRIRDGFGHRQAFPDYQPSSNAAFDLLLDEMYASDAFGGILREEAAKFRQMGEVTRGSALATIRNHLDFLKEPLLWSCLEDAQDGSNTFKLTDLRDQQQFITVYICLPVDMMHQQGRWMRLLVMQVSQFIQRTRFDKERDWPLLLMMDEFFQLGTIPGIENTLTYAPGFGLRLWLIIQDIGQLKKNYPESWETILGACGIKQFFGINDLTTAKYLSELLGEEEIDVPSVSLSRNETSTQATSTTNSFGTSFSSSTSSNWSSTFGRSTSIGGGGRGKGLNVSGGGSFSSTTGGGTSHTEGSSETQSYGTTQSRSVGRGESYSISKQTRKLYRPEEALLAFTKENLVQLLHVRDRGGMLLMRTPYYAEPEMVYDNERIEGQWN